METLTEIIKFVMSKMIPPSLPPNENDDIDAYERQVKSWRVWIAIFTGVNTMTLAAHIALSCGWLPFLYAGFAQASDMNELRKEQVQITHDLKAEQDRRWAIQLSSLIIDQRTKQCKATGELRNALYQNVNKLLQDYYQTTGAQFPLPDCKDLE